MNKKVEDIRWEQRFSNLRKALSQLTRFIEKGDLSELEQQGLIKAFEYTFELAWNTMKDYLEYQGILGVIGSRDAIRLAFQNSLIEQGETWMLMIESRNRASHTYNEDIADQIANEIKGQYHSLFTEFEETMETLRSGSKSNLF